MAEVFIIDASPLAPFLDNFLAIQQHAAEDDTGRSATTLLSIVKHQALADFNGQRAVQLMLKFVDVVLGAAFTEVLADLLVVGLTPGFDAPPGVGDWGRWRQTLAEAL